MVPTPEDIVGNELLRAKDRSLRTGVGAELGEGGFLGSGPAGVRLNAGESLLERILGRDVLACCYGFRDRFFLTEPGVAARDRELYFYRRQAATYQAGVGNL